MKPILEVVNLTMKFGELIANNNISFKVNEGEIVGLIGPNGAGKTTLFNCITGYYRPFSGKVYFLGEDITGFPPYEIAKRGAVRTFQIVKPLKELSVLSNVMIGAFLREPDSNRARVIAEDVLNFCGMLDLKDKPAGSLTISDKKKLELARALATRPRLLLLDEVMAGLTSTEVKEAVRLILKIRDMGITLLVVEHIMEAIMPIADRVVVLDGGEKIAEDVPEKVVNDEKVIKAYLGEKYHARYKRS
ncbi:MAG: ABC transporter ATP-binding protein [Synergistetes bacterium]|nr:MAG: LivG3 [bacterium 42_11]MBC7331768.1 ABC transporter ATP-binding protein [Synergistota bacterium]MDK2870712.1 branched-chain amino acid transport system ATP-binding protein [bacterium]